MCVYVWCGCAGVYTWIQYGETRSFFIFASVSSPRTITGFLKSSSTNSTNDKPSLESVRAAAEFSTPTSHVQYSRSRTVATNGSLLHYNSVAGGMMQKWCKREASFATRWPSGRGLPTPQQTSGAQANLQRSCQLREWERGVGGASRPVPAPGKSGRLLGCLAEWLAGRLRGWLGDHVAPLCKLELGTTPVSSPPIPPLRSTAGLTDACKAPEDSAQLPALSEVRPK